MGNPFTNPMMLLILGMMFLFIVTGFALAGWASSLTPAE